VAIVMFALAGFLIGGAYSLYRGGNRIPGLILALGAVTAACAAVLWMP
jgi:hypothetical protein